MIKKCRRCCKILIDVYKRVFCETCIEYELATEGDVLRLLKASMEPLLPLSIVKPNTKINVKELQDSLQIAIDAIYKDTHGTQAYSDKKIMEMEKLAEQKQKKLECEELTGSARRRLEISLEATQECIDWRIFIESNANKS